MLFLVIISCFFFFAIGTSLPKCFYLNCEKKVLTKYNGIIMNISYCKKICTQIFNKSRYFFIFFYFKSSRVFIYFWRGRLIKCSVNFYSFTLTTKLVMLIYLTKKYLKINTSTQCFVFKKWAYLSYLSRSKLRGKMKLFFKIK